ncbi:MAG TPA: ABC transporter ATP-binding protein, partial [Alphaproteobacteria bacterium]|nr:ABC transporter ATP-binding protein [Alphaproteobacteria bacterium]
MRELVIAFDTPDGVVEAVNGISLDLYPGEVLGIVGESGSGKSQSWMATLGLLADNASTKGEVIFDGHNLLDLDSRILNTIRGQRISMVFQDPMTSLNPYLDIGTQMMETLRTHDRSLNRAEARRRCVEMLDRVAIPDADRRMRQYPHELSGGMRQRVMIAIALLNDPDVLIADEPTTALDVTIQAEILDILTELQRERGMAVVFIT